ncbi:hypothetical protein PAL_GLEAN10017884 [Pteropus alecto]|uniref:Uncharacterized protein n=1 Tax=Pteropus alecto TaxID=9402 RepID=L5KYS3_PTEAL|nr:hypothetical protein PAL_GLEAN10017884 [Pteropus alecto]
MSVERFEGSTRAADAPSELQRREVRGGPWCRRQGGSGKRPDTCRDIRGEGLRSVPLRPPLGPEICHEGGGGTRWPIDARLGWASGPEEKVWPVPSPTRPCRKCGEEASPSTLCPWATYVPVTGFKHLHTAKVGERRPPPSSAVIKPLEDGALLWQEEFRARYLLGRKAGVKHLYFCCFDMSASEPGGC